MLGYKAFMMWGRDDINQPMLSHEPNDLRTWGCENTSKHTLSIWGWQDPRIKGNAHENEEMRRHGHQQTRINPRVSGCEDARMQANTNKPGNMTKGCEEMRRQPNTQEPEYIRMWGCKDASKHT